MTTENSGPMEGLCQGGGPRDRRRRPRSRIRDRRRWSFLDVEVDGQDVVHRYRLPLQGRRLEAPATDGVDGGEAEPLGLGLEEPRAQDVAIPFDDGLDDDLPLELRLARGQRIFGR